MNTNIPQITQQIAFLNSQHLEELGLFIEFLMSKQAKADKKKTLPKSKKPLLLSDIKPLNMPVSDYIIDRNTIYDDRL